MGFGLLVITTASLVLQFGPGKALRASSLAEIEDALETMKNKSHTCFWFFIGELVFFHISSFMLMWILYSPFVAFIVNLVLLAFLLQFMSEGLYVMEKLYVRESDAVKNEMQMINRNRGEIGRLDQNITYTHGSYDPSFAARIGSPMQM